MPQPQVLLVLLRSFLWWKRGPEGLSSLPPSCTIFFTPLSLFSSGGKTTNDLSMLVNCPIMPYASPLMTLIQVQHVEGNYGQDTPHTAYIIICELLLMPTIRQVLGGPLFHGNDYRKSTLQTTRDADWIAYRSPLQQTMGLNSWPLGWTYDYDLFTPLYNKETK